MGQLVTTPGESQSASAPADDSQRGAGQNSNSSQNVTGDSVSLQEDSSAFGKALNGTSENNQDSGAPASQSSAQAESIICDLAFNHGQYFDSYLATEDNRQHFLSSNGAGLVSYVQNGRYLLVSGGLIAPTDQRKQLLAEFVSFAEAQKLTAAFYSIGAADLSYFRDMNFQVTKWGEEPVIDLGEQTWRGKPFEWVRRQTNYCLRNGLKASEIKQDDISARQWEQCLAEVRQVAAESISAKLQAEMTFFEGSITNSPIRRRRLFVARNENGLGRTEAFVICNPLEGGRKWSTELYRRRLDCVRGTMGFLFHHVLQQMQEEGVQQVPMCLDLGKNVEAAMCGDSPLVRRSLIIGRRYLNGVFDFAGMQHFKSRFRPRYEERFVCVRPKATVGSIFAFFRASGALRIDVSKLTNKVRKRRPRRAQNE